MCLYHRGVKTELIKLTMSVGDGVPKLKVLSY